uniref:DNA methyltransferase 1-associated protein 1 n=1 Tax=Ditylenchus dipsaci TaxID=166011 RepID=A0A915E2V5_9BILA
MLERAQSSFMTHSAGRQLTLKVGEGISAEICYKKSCNEQPLFCLSFRRYSSLDRATRNVICNRYYWIDAKPANGGNKKPSISERPRKEVFKRPAGMSTELFRLIQGPSNEDMRNTVMADRSGTPEYTTPKFARKNAIKWTKIMVIKHGLKQVEWVRQGDNYNTKEKAKEFPSFDALSFTDEEYIEHLQAENWTKDETSYLMDLCHLLNLRWPAIDSHFQCNQSGLGSTKAMEDMKERYYDVFNKLKLLRKEQLIKLANRTAEQIIEEKELRAAIGTTKQKHKEQQRKTADLKRLVTANAKKSVPAQSPQPSLSADSIDSQLSRSIEAIQSPNIREKRFVGRPRSVSIIPKVGKEVLDQLEEEPAEARSICQKFSSTHFRSEEFSLHSSVGMAKTKMIVAGLPQWSKNPRSVATRDMAVLYDKFVSNVVLLQALKKSLAFVQDLQKTKNDETVNI